MTESDEVRKSVSKAYAAAVTTSAGPCSCAAPVQKGTVVKAAGYTTEELEALPDEAVVNSFGCGNPLAFSDVREGDVVLDLGSGAGIDILIAAKKVGPTGRVIGVDMTDEMIVKAQENIALSGLTNVDVRKGLIEDLPVETASVDWVVSNCVINLSPEKSKVFAEIARVLKPGGRISISDIVVKDLPERLRNDNALYCGCVAGAISEEEYVEGLRQAGLIDVEVRERIVYDACQLRAFLKSELPDPAQTTSSCCGSSGANFNLDELAESLTGRIWSAKFCAGKPESTGACCE